MPAYQAPLRDMRFVLFELHGAETLAGLPGYGEATPDLFATVLEAAAAFTTEKLLPLNRSGDEEGARFENGTVRTPAGFKQAYDAFAAAGSALVRTRPRSVPHCGSVRHMVPATDPSASPGR